jgi:hypothetical protein
MILPLLKTAVEMSLSDYGLEGLTEGKSVTLYHGTTKLFKTFSLDRSHAELVENFYGSGIFLTPSKRVAEKYANANRNIGFDPSLISDLKRKNANAGAFLESLYKLGVDAWEEYPKSVGLWRENPAPREGALDVVGLEKHLKGVDPNSLGDIAGYIIGSKIKPLGSDGGLSLFNTSTGAPDWLYNTLDEVGLNSKVYRPKVYTVSVTVSNPLLTANKAEARKARTKGYDSVVYYGPDLVMGVPEVAVYDPRKVKVRGIQVP